jgi:hypothetical protein
MSDERSMIERLKATLADYEKLLRVLKQRAWMRQDFREADEIARAIGDELPTTHEGTSE